ncbi:sulfatase-like hydrolase/transferase [Hungatella sp. SB206]|uniref:sulfatase-like hydrolase/transferase n=1 Tax=Hungatella sp. SB206 TaxID=2937758 RepID=UPI003DAA0DBA
MKKPNVIMINSDHQALHQWTFYENKPHRPYYEQFVREGAEFTHACCAAPLCGPSRRSLLTGLYPHAHKQYHNETNPPYADEVYLDSLAEAGYRNYFFGKWHAGPGTALDHHCEGLSLEEYGNPYVTKEYKDYLKKRNLPAAAHRIERVFFWEDKSQQAYQKSSPDEIPRDGEIFKLQDPRHCCEAAYGITVTPKETLEFFFLSELACEKLEELSTDGNDAPFSLRVDFWGPHQPYFPTQEYYDLYKAVSYPPYASFNSVLEGKPEVYFTEKNVPIGKDNRIVIPNALAWEDYEEMLKCCAAQITMIDEAIGRTLNKVKELGLEENTVIIWTADHGDGLACHGGHFDKGSYLSQEVLRVPLGIKWKGRIDAGLKIDAPVCTVDVPVTIMDAAGLEYKNSVHGESLIPICMGKKTPEYAVSETYGLGYGEYVKARAVTDGNYKLVTTLGQAYELYDLKADPYELKNRYDDPAYGAVQRDMEEKLREWQSATGDEILFFDGSDFAECK